MTSTVRKLKDSVVEYLWSLTVSLPSAISLSLTLRLYAAEQTWSHWLDSTVSRCISVNIGWAGSVTAETKVPTSGF